MLTISDMILLLRTDKPESELHLYNNSEFIDSFSWHAHRTLSDTLLTKIEEFLAKNGSSLAKLTGIGVYQGPGSFTGLRIGISVANALAYSQNIPACGATGDNWRENLLNHLAMHNTFIDSIEPLYGSEVHITQQKK